MINPSEIKRLYDQGENISSAMRKQLGVSHNTEEIIEIAYDFQAGNYVRGVQAGKGADYQKAYTCEVARIINGLGSFETILEAGVGEATTLSGVVENLGENVEAYGFDISWSRVSVAGEWLKRQGIKNASLCTGSLLSMPYMDDSMDVVYTSHSIEPNGGQEKEIIEELYRVARNYLVLLEPGYELADDESRKRMDSHGYCKGLKSIAENLGYKVITHELFPIASNPLNPTALIVIEKKCLTPRPDTVYACPRFKTPLFNNEHAYYSADSFMVYPVIQDVPCLRVENGVVASKYNPAGE